MNEMKKPEEQKNKIPPQYESLFKAGMSVDDIEEIWVDAIPVNPDQAKRNAEERAEALAGLREKEGVESGQRAEEVREKIGLSKMKNNEREKNPVKNIEEFMNLPKIKFFKDKILNELEGNWDPKVDDSMETVVYKMLTTRDSYFNETNGSEEGRNRYLKSLKGEVKQYQNLLDEIVKKVKGDKNLKQDDNPKWFSVDTRAESSGGDGINYKTYNTVSSEEYDFIKHFPFLVKKLRKISLEEDDFIKVKIPIGISAFKSHNDSLVVHFKNPKNVNKIQDAINDWMIENSITEEKRDLGRTKFAADPKKNSKGEKTSFSQAVSENIAEWLKDNIGKYDNELLADLAVKYAIERSQKSPSIDNKKI